MSDTIKLKKGLKANRPILQLSELTCDNDAGNERLVYGGLNGDVEFPNMKDISSINSQLAEKVNQVDLDTANTNIALKADKTSLDTTNSNLTSTNTNVANLQTQITSLSSGSPKGTFATLSALQADETANTTDGKKYIYVVTADGNWYYWNGTAWMSGGTYQSTSIGNGNVMKLNLESKLYALIGNEYEGIAITWNSGSYFDYTQHTVVTNTDSSNPTAYSNTLSVNEGEEYEISGSYYFNAKLFAVLDKNNNVLAYYPTANNGAGKVNNYSFTIPKGGVSLILNKYLGSNTAIANNTVLLKATSFTVQNIAQESITKDNLSNDFDSVFISKYTNIPITLNTGGYYNYLTGSVDSNAGNYQYANPITVSKGEKYRISGSSVYNANLYLITDINGTILSAFPNSFLGTEQNFDDVVFTIPDGGVNLLINKNAHYNTTLFKEYSITNANNLYNKKIAFNGDSIMAGDGASGYSFAKMIAENNGCIYENRAVGGGTLSSGTGASHHVCEDISNMASDADIICIEGGVNDYWDNVPLGTLTGGDGNSSPTLYTDTIDTTTFAGALESIFRQAIAKWTGKPICFVIVHKVKNTIWTPNSLGKNFNDYVNMIISACEKYSIPYCNLWNTSGMICDIPAIATNFSKDGTHPNEAGYRAYYVPQITALLNSLVTQ